MLRVSANEYVLYVLKCVSAILIGLVLFVPPAVATHFEPPLVETYQICKFNEEADLGLLTTGEEPLNLTAERAVVPAGFYFLVRNTVPTPGEFVSTIVIEPGWKTYSGTYGGCDVQFQAYGLSGADTFIIDGPTCKVMAGQKVDYYTLYLDLDDPNLPPENLLVLDNGSVVEVEIAGLLPTAPCVINAFDQENCSGKLRASAEDFEESLNLAFKEAGLYTLTFIWKKPILNVTHTPPAPMEIEISRNTIVVDVRDPANPEECAAPFTPAGLRCKIYKSADQKFAANRVARGVTTCQVGGGFSYEISEPNIRDSIGRRIQNDAAFLVMTSSQKNQLASSLHDRVRECVEEHEREHVANFSNPAFGVSNICDDCCCGRVPELFTFLSAERVAYRCSENKAYQREEMCFRDKKNHAGSYHEYRYFRIEEIYARDKAQTFHCPP